MARKPGHDVVQEMDLPQQGGLLHALLPVRSGNRKLHGDQVLRAESGTGGDEPQKAAAEKAGAGQNHQRGGNFADHQKAAKPLAGTRASVTAGAGGQRFLQIPTPGAPRGKEPQRNGNSYNGGQSEQ